MDVTSPNLSLSMTQATQENAVDKLKAQKIDEAAKEFEAVFVAEMMKPMFEGINTDGMFGGGKGEEVFRGLLINEYGKILAETDSIGIASEVKAEMLRLQEATKTETTGVTGE